MKDKSNILKEMRVRCFSEQFSLGKHAENFVTLKVTEHEGCDHLEFWDGNKFLGYFHVGKDMLYWWGKQYCGHFDLLGRKYPDSHDKVAEQEAHNENQV